MNILRMAVAVGLGISLCFGASGCGRDIEAENKEATKSGIQGQPEPTSQLQKAPDELAK